jgi:glyoxylase-like metal-dependent hydrolase (beta-lactamase superfamily II)
MKMFLRHLFIFSAGLSAACVSRSEHSEVLKNQPSKDDVKSSLYVFESDQSGFNTKTTFFDSGKEVIAFDAQFTRDAAQKAIEFLRTKTKNPITHLVITHPNPDKFNGAGVFRENGAKIVASQATSSSLVGTHTYKKYFFVNIAKMFTEDSYPALTKPDVIFERNLTLKTSDGSQVVLRELGQPGVSANQTVAYIAEHKALVVGDLVHYKAHAWLEGAIKDGKAVPHLAEWRRLLVQLRNEFGKRGTMIYGGRGGVVGAQEALNTQIEYLEKAESIVGRFIQSHKELLKTNPQAGYIELTKAFELEFPDYALAYMITYGAYGLVAQLQNAR